MLVRVLGCFVLCCFLLDVLCFMLLFVVRFFSFTLVNSVIGGLVLR